MEEEAKHLQAFELYYSLGNKRTLKKVSDKINVSVPTLSRWAREFNWKARVEQKDRLFLQELQKRNAMEFEKAVIYYQKAIRGVLKRDILEPLEKGEKLPFQIKSVKDVEILMKLDVLLGGGVTSRTENVTKENKKESEQRVIEMVQKDPETWEKLNQNYIMEGEVIERRTSDN